MESPKFTVWCELLGLLVPKSKALNNIKFGECMKILSKICQSWKKELIDKQIICVTGHRLVYFTVGDLLSKTGFVFFYCYNIYEK